MSIKNEYLKRVYEQTEKRNPGEPEFMQTVSEVFESLEPVIEAHPEYEKAGLIIPWGSGKPAFTAPEPLRTQFYCRRCI